MYSPQPVLIRGLQTVIETLDGFALTAVDSMPLLMEEVQKNPPNVILIEVTPEVRFAALSDLKSVAANAYVVLWVSSVSTEFVSQAIALGVRGILRKNLPIDLQVKCLQKVADGELWVEKHLTDRLLTSTRVALTARERQLVGLLAQGLKNKEMAYLLGITEGTVKVYLSKLYRKVGASDRFELALFALKNFSANQAGDWRSESPVPLDKPRVDSWFPRFVTMDRAPLGMR